MMYGKSSFFLVLIFDGESMVPHSLTIAKKRRGPGVNSRAEPGHDRFRSALKMSGTRKKSSQVRVRKLIGIMVDSLNQ
jgi:hypothetical protein